MVLGQHWARLLAGGVLLPVITALPFPLAAQSVDACMQANGKDAISICEKMLDSGSRNENVYYRLASELYQQGDAPTALELIAEGLSIHPNNSNLIRLRSYVEVDTDEATQLKESAQKNENVIQTGKLKILCRTKNSKEGLAACREYLSRTNVDQDVIGPRLAALEKQFQPQIDKPEAVDEDVASIEIEKPIASTPAPPPIKPEPEQPDPTTVAVNQAESALRVLVFDVQSSLQQLGFNTGSPDGIPGVRTRQALTSFYDKSNIPDNEFSQNGFISESTLLDLVDANRERQQAQRLLTESQLADKQGNAPLALLKLNQAEDASPFVVPPTDYRGDLTAKILAMRKPTPEPAPDSTPPPAQNLPDNEVATGDIDKLMDQIKRLEAKMQLNEKNLQDSLRVINETISRLQF